MGKKLIAQGQVTIQTQNDSYTIIQSVGDYNFTAVSNGTINKATTLVSTIRVTQGDTIVSDFVIGSIAKPVGFASIVVNNTDKTITYTVNQNTTNLADNGIVNIPLTIKGIIYNLSFSWSKTKDGAKGSTGAAGSSGIDANLLDWVKDWNSNKTVIDSQTVITPKIFTGTKNANGTVSGVAIGQFNLKTVNPTGTVITSLVNGIYGFKDGYSTFSVENTGNVQLGRNNQFVRYNATTGKIEFGSEVSLNWVSAINTAKNDAVTTASKDASTKADNAKNNAIKTASDDATTKANKAKSDAVTSASSDATTKANKAKTDAVASAASDATTKANKAKADAVTSAANDATNKANKAKIDAITDATTKINAIQIGGTNLLNNSGNWKVAGWNKGFSSNGGGYTIDNAVLYNGASTIKTLVGTGLQHPWIKLENGVEYTYSAVVMSNEAIGGTGSVPLHCQSGKDNASQSKLTIVKFDTTVLANKWKKITLTFKLNGDANSLRPFFYRGANGSTIYWIAYLKLEKGNVATDWTPSTNDVTANILSAEQAGKNAQQVADNLTKKANDEKWSTKLTHIDANGIFTGTLSANIVNAMKINASQITAGTIDAARINVASLKASLITAGNIEALTLNVTKGKIGGWIIDGDSIYRGAKNNAINGYTNASGAISIGSNGIRGFKWRLESNGSGALAAGNIAWDAAGNVTFGAKVVLNWTNAANNALTTAKSYADVKKTEAINSAATDASNKVNSIKIGGTNYAQSTSNEWRKHPALTNKSNECVLPYTILSDNWVVGDIISVSFDFKYENIAKSATQGCLLRIQGAGNVTEWNYGFTSYDVMKYVDFVKKTGQIRISYTFTLSKEQASNSRFSTNFRCDYLTGSISVSNFMVEKGTKASDWSPAKEDVDKTISEVNKIATGAQGALGGVGETGIYTGTLSANTINVIKINATQITAGTIDAARINVGALKTSLITAGNIDALTLNVTKGKIGGWVIGSDTITIGAIGTVGATPIQLRSKSVGSGYWYNGAYKPYGLTLTWHQSANAGHVVFGQIASSGNTVKTGFVGIQMMAWDNTEYFCLSANSTKSGAKEIYNRIAGWAFDNTRIWKNNVSLGSDGAIYNGNLWRLNNDGSGRIANGNITWNAAGTVTFAATVSLNWTNAATNALNSAKTYADAKKNEAISSAATDATNKAEAAKELALAMAFGKMMYRDPTFYNGNNGLNIYNNSNNGTVTIARTSDGNAPNDSKQVLVVKNTGAASPNCGGFHWSTQTAFRKIFITRIIAKIPTGRTITYHANNIGTGGSQKWLTPIAGTGDWKEYICKVSCGTSSFSTTNFFAISGAVGTPTAPVEWRVAYATVFDLTSTEKYTTTIDANGVYTGTVKANQVLIDNALVVGGSTYNGSISVRDASNTVKVTLNRSGITAVGGVIGGWNIAATQISKNSVILGSDGTISNGTKWKLGNDGSGYVANSNLTWTAAGQVTLKGKIEAKEGIIGGFTISGNKLINRSADSAIEFSSLSGASSLMINANTQTLLSLRADTARTGIFIQTYATGAKGIYIIANAGSTHAIESYGPHKFGQRMGETWSAPGVLFSAVCKMGSTLYHQWGNGLVVTRFYKESTGGYYLEHNLGHTQYTVIASPYWDHGNNGHSNAYVRAEFINPYRVKLRIVNAEDGGMVDTCFTFAVIGRNKI